jgi:MFS family permease
MTQTVPTVEAEALSHRRVLVIIGALLLGMLLAALDQTIVATALPTIAGDLHGLSHLSWVVTAYLLASTASTPLWGRCSPPPAPSAWWWASPCSAPSPICRNTCRS